MAKASAVWGIDVGQCALKAVKLHRAGEEVAVEAFDIIEHEKILSQPDADRAQLIRSALEQFLARNNVRNTPVLVSMPGLTSFPCYVKLPPVEDKKIPDIVRFEAQQQIPLPLEEVVWQYQTFKDPDSPDIEVGIFAVRRTDVAAMLEQFSAVALSVDAVQMAPLALFNFMDFDGQRAEDGATILIDVGADKTDLVVADKTRLWTRTIRIGGNNFTEALVRAFKLSFSKAEKLKRTAATSKYARQIFQAMRPVFADLVQEIQRSLGHYTSLHRETRWKKILALGNGFRLPGFQKYLEQNLNIPVVRLDAYNHLKTTGPADTPVFTENIMSFAVAYGLALQGLGLTSVETNLLPTEIARKKRWTAKKPWFAGAAAVAILSLAGPAWRSYADLSSLEPGAALRQAQAVAEDLDRLRLQREGIRNQGKPEEEQVNRLYGLYGSRNLVPAALNMVDRCITEFAKDQPKFGNTEAERAAAIAKLHAILPRSQRKTITVELLEIVYVPDLRAAVPQGTPGVGDQAKHGLRITLRGRTPLNQARADSDLIRPMLRDSNIIASAPLDGTRSPISVVYWPDPKFTPGAPAATPAPGLGAAGAAAVRDPDPLMAWATSTDTSIVLDPSEDIADDTRFEITWYLLIEEGANGGLPPLKSSQSTEAKGN